MSTGNEGQDLASLASRLAGKTKPITPPGEIRQAMPPFTPQLVAEEPRQTVSESDNVCISQPHSVAGIVSIEDLVARFRVVMTGLLDEKMSAIGCEMEEVRSACIHLAERVEVLEQKNKELQETVNFLTSHDSRPNLANDAETMQAYAPGKYAPGNAPISREHPNKRRCTGRTRKSQARIQCCRARSPCRMERRGARAAAEML